jgi:predicted nucleic acid-binding protein
MPRRRVSAGDRRAARGDALAVGAGGPGRTSTTVAALVDTNVLVYRFDPRFPRKQEVATRFLRSGLIADRVRIPHQALVEFVAVVTRPLPEGGTLLSHDEARREVEELLATFVILYPTEGLLRTAIRGWATYQLGWFDAHLWAYAEEYGLAQLASEDFQHDRLYGTVRAVNPFI